eukprot:11189161-Lingulodinium_polyedra.AAC.1
MGAEPKLGETAEQSTLEYPEETPGAASSGPLLPTTALTSAAEEQSELASLKVESLEDGLTAACQQYEADIRAFLAE